MTRSRRAPASRRQALPPDLIALSERLGYHFRDRRRLLEAFTHASTGGAFSYERLEFLGDRVIGLVVAEMLFRHFPKEAEGALARRHAELVRQDTLARVAGELKLADHLRLSPGEVEAGGRANPALLADACEALLGAIYLDGGLAPARLLIEQQWQPLLEAALQPPQDNKTALQEWAQGSGLPLPHYLEVSRTGSAHEPLFTVRVIVEGAEQAQGQGRSKRMAEQAAAGALLELLRAEGRIDDEG